ncbi:MAG: leucine-rich repeat domain-containing protein [Candidatus Diapherotrites archaeon]
MKKFLLIGLVVISLLLSGCPDNGPPVTPPDNGGTTPPTNGGTTPPTNGGTAPPTANLCSNLNYSTESKTEMFEGTFIMLTEESQDKLEKKMGDEEPNPLSGISGLTCLERFQLVLSSNWISSPKSIHTLDYDSLSTLTNMKRISFNSHKALLQGPELAFLANMKNLEEIEIVFSELNDLSEFSKLSGHTKLKEINLLGNEITDISPLANIKSLTGVFIGSNNITDFTPLYDLPNLKSVSMGNNPGTDASCQALKDKLPNAMVICTF